MDAVVREGLGGAMVSRGADEHGRCRRPPEQRKTERILAAHKRSAGQPAAVADGPMAMAAAFDVEMIGCASGPWGETGHHWQRRLFQIAQISNPDTIKFRSRSCSSRIRIAYIARALRDAFKDQSARSFQDSIPLRDRALHVPPASTRIVLSDVPRRRRHVAARDHPPRGGARADRRCRAGGADRAWARQAPCCRLDPVLNRRHPVINRHHRHYHVEKSRYPVRVLRDQPRHGVAGDIEILPCLCRVAFLLKYLADLGMRHGHADRAGQSTGRAQFLPREPGNRRAPRQSRSRQRRPAARPLGFARQGRRRAGRAGQAARRLRRLPR
jgi:hypothetical protein